MFDGRTDSEAIVSRAAPKGLKGITEIDGRSR